MNKLIYTLIILIRVSTLCDISTIIRNYCEIILLHIYSYWKGCTMWTCATFNFRTLHFLHCQLDSLIHRQSLLLLPMVKVQSQSGQTTLYAPLNKFGHIAYTWRSFGMFVSRSVCRSLVQPISGVRLTLNPQNTLIHIDVQMNHIARQFIGPSSLLLPWEYYVSQTHLVFNEFVKIVFFKDKDRTMFTVNGINIWHYTTWLLCRWQGI